MSDPFGDKPDPSRNDNATPRANAGPVSPQIMKIVMLTVACLTPRKDNRSVTHEDVLRGGLLASIEANGVLVPLIVRNWEGDRYEVIAGHRRLFCLKLLGRDKAPCIVLEGEVSEARVIQVRLAENVIREAMSPIEQAEDILRYMRLTKCTQIEAANTLHLSQATVSRILSIKRLAPDLKPHVENFQVVPSIAYLIASLPLLEQQRSLMMKAIGPPPLTRDQVQTACEGLKGKKQAMPPAIKTKTPGGCLLTATPRPGMTPHAFLEELKEYAKAVGADMSKLDGKVPEQTLWMLFKRKPY